MSPQRWSGQSPSPGCSLVRATLGSALLAVGALGVVLAFAISAWFLLAVPVGLIGGAAVLLGLSGQQLLDALEGTAEDPGRGPAGVTI